jgi:trimeric autotransporter adhesin
MMSKKRFLSCSLLISHCLCLQLLRADEESISDISEAKKVPEICEEYLLSKTEDEDQLHVEELILNKSEEEKLPAICEEQAITKNEDELQPKLDDSLLGQDEKIKFDKQSILLEQNTESTCGKGPRPYYVTLRHIEGNGVGYNQGYTTLEGFFRTPNPDIWVPFLDVRYHFFNNGKPALNTGLGLRYLTTSRVWGINGYYDYRKTNHQHYNQISMGLESLGKIWDFRINGYLPVGKKTSGLFDTRFDEFKNHFLYIRQKKEFAMKGANAEVGAHVNRYKNAPLYFAMGPYYLEGQGKVAWGGEARAAADLFGCLRLEASTSYDNVFKWIGQGQVSLVIPFGAKKQIPPKKGSSCKEQLTIAQRAIQRVDRYEIIPVDRKHKKSVAIDPLTGQPYFFWFVNNLSHSDGTFESPFPMLVQAQNVSSPNDVIYVYPGDGTTTGMESGIILKENQKLFGAGIDQQLQTTAGMITIPALASGYPKITTSSGSTIITCANNNELSGLHVILPLFSTGIGATNFNNINIHNNILDVAEFCTGVDLLSASGQISFLNNQVNILDGVATGVNISINSTNTLSFIENNVFTGNNTLGFVTGISFSVNANFNEARIFNNQFVQMSEGSLNAHFSGTNATVIAIGNQFSANAVSNSGDMQFLISSGSSPTLDLESNIWKNSVSLSTPAIFVQTTGAGNSACVNLISNSSDTNPGFTFDTTSGGSITADVLNNIGTVTGTYTPGVCPVSN